MNICAITTAVILYFGNSICYTPGYPAGQTIPQMLDAQCAASVVADCVQGRGTQRPGWDGQAPLTKFSADLAAYTPDVCVIDLVTNDWNYSSMEQSVANHRAFVEACQAAGALPVLVAGYPITDAGVAYPPMRAGWLGEARQRIVALGRALGVPVVDGWALFNIPTWVTDCTFGGGWYDGVHPFAMSCRQTIADAVTEALP